MMNREKSDATNSKLIVPKVSSGDYVRIIISLAASQYLYKLHFFLNINKEQDVVISSPADLCLNISLPVCILVYWFFCQSCLVETRTRMCIQIIMMFTELPESKSDEFTRLFPGNREGLVQHQSDNPDGTVLRTACSQQVEKIYRLPLRRDDVWIVTFPKCGILNY